MKKFNLFLIAVTIGYFSFGQVTYTSANYAAIGQDFHVSKASTGLSLYNFNATGANTTWDFSTLPVNEQRDIKWISPASGGYQNAWCATNSILFGCISQYAAYANLAKNRLDTLDLGTISLTNVVDHYDKSAAALEYKMQGATINIGGLPIAIPTQYTNTDTIFSFPLNFNDQNSSTSAYQMDFNSYGIPYKYQANRKRTYEIDGWGSLTTPFGNFASVLKMKTYTFKMDTIFTDSLTVPIVDTLISYQWFDPAYGLPVLEATANLIAGVEVITGVTYIDIVRCVKPSPFFVYNPLIIYYDQITKSADVSFINLSANADSSHWEFGDGATSTLNSPSHTYNCPGVFFVELNVANQACATDSIGKLSLPLTVIDTNSLLLSYATATACDSAQVNGKMYYNSQVIFDTLVSLGIPGCDSLVVTTLTIRKSYNETDVRQACTSLTWIDGNTYTTSNNTATFTYQTIHGCDSIIHLDLAIVNNLTSTDVQEACLTYDWIDGNTYTASNNSATHTLTSSQGCDSIITLNLTIYGPVSTTDVRQACSSYTWIDGNTYTSDNNTATHTLSSIHGCDSTVTLDLSIVSTLTSTDVIKACGSYKWIDGNTYTSNNNTATYTLTSTQSCDSIVSLDLTVNQPSTSSVNEIACGSYPAADGQLLTNSGNYTIVIPNAAGCDSTINLDLTINPMPVISLVKDQNTLTADEVAATYQWLDCNNAFEAIIGETGQSFTATQNGDYAVVITKATCSDTSACINMTGITSLAENPTFSMLRVYPNPTNGSLHLEFEQDLTDLELQVCDLQGRVLQVIPVFQQKKIDIELKGNPGLYLLKLNRQDAVIQVVRIIKE